MASGKRREGETWNEYRLRLKCEGIVDKMRVSGHIEERKKKIQDLIAEARAAYDEEGSPDTPEVLNNESRKGALATDSENASTD